MGLSSDGFGDAGTVGGIGLCEVGDHLVLQFFGDLFEASGDVLAESLLMIGCQQPEEVARLDVIVIDAAFLLVPIGVSGDFERRLAEGGVFFGAAEAVGFIDDRGASVVVKPHGAVALVVVHGALGGVDGQAFEIDAEAIALGVGVGDDAGLEHLAG